MKKISLIFIFCSLVLSASGSDEIKYAVSQIPDELKKDVNAVVREDKMIFIIQSASKATLYAYLAVTIFNENAKEYASFQADYDKLTKLNILSGAVYDASGKLIKKLKGSEIYDQSAYDGSLYSDNRMKSTSLSQSTYPYTVVFEYEKEYKFLFLIDGSTIIGNEKIAVQKASYQLIYPTDLAPRYKTYNIDQKPKKEILANGVESLLWEFDNVKPITFEPFGRRKDVTQRIAAAPSQFEYDGYKGQMQTWNEFGKWIASLNKGRDVVPDATKQKIRELTANLKTVEKKTKAVYEFVQNKSRYVSIQLGIGGLQPFSASVVDKLGYGDCKALSNYTVSLLSEIGVKANYVLIMAGANAEQLHEDFPSSQFNHATVCVPNGKDTLWLECTSQTNPFGYAGRFTGDRKALAITEAGAKIVHTPVYGAQQNVQSRIADVFIEVNGNAKAKIKTTYSGLQYENDGLDFVLENRQDDQKKWLQENIDIPNFDLTSFSMINRKEKNPSAIVNVDLTLNRFATVSGKRMFLTANLMNRSSFVPEKVENRKTNVIIKMAYTDFDTIRYRLPEQFYSEFLPEPVKFSSRFGEYEVNYKLDQGNLVYIRKVKMNKGEFPPESYQELIDFYKNINRTDNSKIVFLSKT